MFSGIVEGTATVVGIVKEQGNVHFTLQWDRADELKIDQSLSHNGVCLTVVAVDKDNKTYKVTAIKETLMKSNLGLLENGSKVNLERSMPMNGRLDGHIVQGHVDQTAVCTKVEEADGSWYYTFEYDFDKEKARQGYMTVEKGSVTVNGVSLTVVNSKDNSFQVAIIPFTWEVTNFHTFKAGTVINLEFDIIGKYLSKLMKYQ
jgi:riboflavin synthase